MNCFKSFSLDGQPAAIVFPNLLVSLVYALVALGFLIRLLVASNVITPIYFAHFGIGSNGSVGVILMNEHSSVICFFASFVYSILALMAALNKVERNILRQLNRISDAIFFSLLLAALVHYNDIIQRISLVAIYVAFQLDVLDVENVIHSFAGENDGFKVAKLKLLTLVVLFTTFWVSYILGVAYNVNLNRDGGGVAQAFSFIVMVNDAVMMFEIFTFRKIESQISRIIVDLVVRFILLVCVFVETV